MERLLLLKSTPHDGLKNGTHIDVEVYYTQGGTDNFAGRATPRGYYLSVKPVKRDDTCVLFNAFTGYRKLLLETDRFSVKQFEKAVGLGRAAATKAIEHVLIEEKAA